MPVKPLPLYSDCIYSLFVSYAHDDDKFSNGWITALRLAVWRRVAAGLPRDITKLPLHFSADNGPSCGTLASELKERVGKSFAMLIVLGHNYVTSNWCEQELQYLVDTYGVEAVRSRLFIVAMSRSALTQARQGAVWRRMVPPDIIHVEMFSDDAPEDPLRARLDEKDFAEPFHQRSTRVSDPLIDRIVKDFRRDEAVNAAKTVAGEASGLAPRGDFANRRIAIGPCLPSLRAHLARLADKLAKAGAEVNFIDPALLPPFDPDAKGDPMAPIAEQLKKADVLIMPITDEKPLRPDVDGGHASMMKAEWEKLIRPRPVVWYRPDGLPVAKDALAVDRHLAVFKGLAPVCSSTEAVLSLLFGPGSQATITLYIEKHKKFPPYDLASKIAERWRALPEADRPPLQCDYLEWGRLKAMRQDAAGFVLLWPRGLKNEDSIAAQQKLLEGQFKKQASMYPGCVAFMYKDAGDTPACDWPLVEFVEREGGEPALDIDPDSDVWLTAFLRHILNEHRKNGAQLA